MFLNFIKLCVVVLVFSFTFANFGSIFRSGGLNIFIFDIVSFLIFFPLVIYILKLKKFSVNLPFIFGNFFGFLSLTVLYFSFQNFNLEENLKSFFYLSRFFVYFYNSYLIYILISEKELTQEFIKKVLFINFLFFIFLIIVQLTIFYDLSEISVYGYDPHFGRVVGSFLDPNFLGFYLILYFWFATFIIENRIISISSFSLILATQSRSALLTLFIFFLLWLIIKRKIDPLIYSMLTVVFILFSPMLQKFEHYSKANDSVNLRFQSFENGYLISRFSDFLGIGFNNYKNYQKSLGLLDESRVNTNVSNFNDSSFVSIYVLSGILGLSVFILFLSSFLKNTSALILILIVFISSNMNNLLFYPPISFTIFLFIFISLLEKKICKKELLT
jgi:hypothetical protein